MPCMRPRKAWIRAVSAGMVVGVAVTAAHLTSLGARIGFAVYDLWHVLAPGPSPAADIIIVAIDDESLLRLGRWPWPRSRFAELLAVLAEEKPRAIGIDVIMPEPSEDSSSDQALARAAAASGRTVFPFYAESKVLPRGSRVFHASGGQRPPYPELARSAILGSVIAIPDPDGVLRRHLPVIVDDGRLVYSMSLELVRLYLGLPSTAVSLAKEELRMGPIRIPLDATGRVLIRYSSGRPGGARYKTISCHKVLDGDFEPGEFRDKIALVGACAQGLHDFYFVPLSSAGNPMPGVEVHANVVQAILQGQMVRRVPEPAMALLSIGAALLLLAAFRKLHPARAGAWSCASGLGAASLSFVLFSAANVWVDPVPLIGVAAASLACHLVASFVSAEHERARVRATFSRYLPKAVVDEVLRAGEGVSLGGRKLDVTVMFADIRGFTPYAEREAPERVVEVLNAHLSAMTEAVFREGGTLDKFTGDGVMAVFGAPLPQPDHALRAARAALAIRDALCRPAACGRGDDIRLQVGIGMASGEVIAGNVGTLARMDYTVIGDVANLAARLEGIAGPAQVLACARTYEAIRGKIATRPVGSVAVDGRSAPVAVYELL